ncbi:hypothetical protein [Kingella oralis]|jgi:hypothetical protein|uniref:hypothetical protein n=1 Tax=Kingella oralis TaxID=505 RepID=UPI00206D315B|nr:MAG TPA: Baseplate wedge protein [Caudoviricetes sp.]DAR26176.1 MAG TPA: Baseplate wedge protein [Caudoviricetes sp.]DAT92728.1 MAG TPA: Baseplate wedge protein [Caudoviricetes sp.]
MSVDLKLDASHDLDFADGRLHFVAGEQRIRQQVVITLKTFLGEWFLDNTHGVPYLENILVKNPNRAEVEAILRAKIKAVPNVAGVPKMQLLLNHPTRSLVTVFEIETDDGRVIAEVRI